MARLALAAAVGGRSVLFRQREVNVTMPRRCHRRINSVAARAWGPVQHKWGSRVDGSTNHPRSKCFDFGVSIDLPASRFGEQTGHRMSGNSSKACTSVQSFTIFRSIRGCSGVLFWPGSNPTRTATSTAPDMRSTGSNGICYAVKLMRPRAFYPHQSNWTRQPVEQTRNARLSIIGPRRRDQCACAPRSF
jgi:hypothetical protein